MGPVLWRSTALVCLSAPGAVLFYRVICRVLPTRNSSAFTWCTASRGDRQTSQELHHLTQCRSVRLLVTTAILMVQQALKVANVGDCSLDKFELWKRGEEERMTARELTMEFCHMCTVLCPASPRSPCPGRSQREGGSEDATCKTAWTFHRLWSV